MYVKTHRSQHDEVLAMCDEEILGKTLEDKKYTLAVSEHFYKGEKMNAEQVTPLLKKATNANLIGKKTIALALKLKIIEKENIIVIAGVPHAQAYA